MSDPGPYRDGKVHVCAVQCSTCVFRSGNLMHLAPGRLRDLVEQNLAADAVLQCHQTLPYYPGRRPSAICRGYFDAYSDQVWLLRLAQSGGVIVFDEG